MSVPFVDLLGRIGLRRGATALSTNYAFRTIKCATASCYQFSSREQSSCHCEWGY